ncbi:MAG: Crp/Fnr family transcriptional regulator [Acidobacteriota bacterium]
MAKPRPAAERGNRLLAALPALEYARLKKSLEIVRLERRKVLHEPGAPMGRVYFPRTAVASMVTTMEDGSTVEVATIGNEGIVGLPVFLGTETMPMEVSIQIDGEAACLSASAFKEATRNGGALRPLLERYTQALLFQIAQSGACNRLHPIDQRCARWLLLSHDRVPGDAFALTQEFLSQMLGVRRATVTAAASILQRAGYIRYSRGVIEITDRRGLERASCECYRVIRDEYERLIR